MNIFHQLFLRLCAGFPTRGTFDAYLTRVHKQVALGIKLKEFDEHFILRNDVMKYWRDIMTHNWIAYKSFGGKVELGEHNRQEAIEMFGRLVRGGSIIHIDDLQHFIFYKLES
jgi:hypothetical protein